MPSGDVTINSPLALESRSYSARQNSFGKVAWILQHSAIIPDKTRSGKSMDKLHFDTISRASFSVKLSTILCFSFFIQSTGLEPINRRVWKKGAPSARPDGTSKWLESPSFPFVPFSAVDINSALAMGRSPARLTHRRPWRNGRGTDCIVLGIVRKWMLLC